MLELVQNLEVAKMTREETLMAEIERLKRENRELIKHNAEMAFYIELLEDDLDNAQYNGEG